MTIYLDSAIISEAERAEKFGWVSGVTTNPILFGKAKIPPEETLRKLASLNFKKIYYQLKAPSVNEMKLEAEKAAKLVGEKLVLKIPPTEPGYEAVSVLSKEFPCCITAVFTNVQAVVARDAGARYVAVYFNRAEKLLGDGTKLVREISSSLQGDKTEILVASIKSSEEAQSALAAGAHHLTMDMKVLRSIIYHKLSDQAVNEFNNSGVGIKFD